MELKGNITAHNTPAKISCTQNAPLYAVAGTVVSKAGTITGTAGVGSSLFLQRILIPEVMNLSEIQIAMSIGFPATNQGAGTMSRSFVLYSFGNSTSLASVVSASSSSTWGTGTSTAGGSVSLTQFQGGWSVPLIQPMTFPATSIIAGEYVIGQIFDFAQASSTWTLNLYGLNAAATALAAAATNVTSATLGAMSSAALSAASALTGLSTITTGVAANTNWLITHASSAVSSANIGSASNVSNAITAVQVPQVVSLATVAGSIFTAATGSLGAVTNVAVGALSSTTLAQLTFPNFGYIGTGSTTSNLPTVFLNGIMSTGAIPTAITLTSTAVTFSGSIAFQQPWFALLGT